MTEFIFLRPDLLWLLLLPGFYLIWRLVASKDEQQQQPLIAPHLAAQVMQEGAEQRQNNGLLNALLLALMVVAMAGPSFSKLELPVYEAKMARVMVMDMSRSMFSTDISPNRLQQARFKALDMVELFKEGETALIAYAGDAFTISPLTSDSQTLTNLIPSLSPDIMPEQGSNVLAALTLAQELLEQADYPQGDIILISDGIDAEEEGDIRTWLSNNDYRLHIYAIGSEQGAPISLPDGGFLKDNQGQIVIPKTNFERLQRRRSSVAVNLFVISQAATTLVFSRFPKANKQHSRHKASKPFGESMPASIWHYWFCPCCYGNCNAAPLCCVPP
ncbi:vWA domain-containing protein [Pseudoalteromonas sp. T1lg75]|uniref:vWA domain-containing protein n=1 Tax=Pseudoalteromonas sp. T1lg75 TaxID=2077102 RepID=UPI002D78B653|nr:VWA domain-containing protein [Pseudoalteromonas sp. T1lg75]